MNVTNASSVSTTPSVYFDNCLVGAVVKGDHPAQMPSLSILFTAHQSGSVALSASTQVLKEIQALPAEYQGPHLAVWNDLRKLPASRVTWIDEQSTARSITTDHLYTRLETVLTLPIGSTFSTRRSRALGILPPLIRRPFSARNVSSNPLYQ